MKRTVLMLLLLSVGLNIGLGFALKRQRDESAASPPVAFHEGRKHADWEGRGPGRGHIPKERMEHMREMRTRIGPELGVQREAFHVARQALHDALSREDADEAEIMARVGDMIAAQGGIDSLVVSHLAREMRTMSLDDRKEILRMLDHFGGGFRGRGRGRPPVSP